MLNRNAPVYGPRKLTKLNLMGIRFIEEPGDGAGAGDDHSEQPKWPADTPVKEMTPEQQAAYHLDKSRKHEARVKAYGDVTPERLAEIIAENERLASANQTESEKAINAAKEEGRAEVRAVLGAERFKIALTSALSGRTADPAALLDLDRSAFIKGDTPDVAAIKKWAEENSTVVTTVEQKRRHVSLGQGNTDQVVPIAGERGKAEAEKRFKK